jgi:hypothetical protein
MAISSDASVLSCAAWLAVTSAVFTLFDILVLRYQPWAAFELLLNRTTLDLILICFRMLVIPGLVMLFVYLVNGFQILVFHGRISYYREILYVATVIFIALLFASKLLALIPMTPVVNSIVTGTMYAYLLLLSGIAVRGITGLPAGKAAGSVIAAGAVTLALVGGSVVLLALLLVRLVP